MQILNKFHMIKLIEIFIILLRNINNLKLVKNRKNVRFLKKKSLKIQFAIESA